MKTREDELEELVDLVIKLTWNYTIFRELFAKNAPDREVRSEHPELFLTLHDALLCSFCIGVAVLFEEKEKATSFWTLIRKAKPNLESSLTGKIRAASSILKKIESLRNQACAHRWQAKTAQDVFAQVRLRFSMMTEIIQLARLVLCELVGEADPGRRVNLEKQQLSERTLRCIAGDVSHVIRAWEA